MHPTALYATKQWAPEHFARLGKFLEDEAGLVPIYSCGPGEQTVLDAVERAGGTAIRRVEGASLGRFAAALAGARIFIGNDSGPAHMAAALGTRLVTLWGPGIFEQTAPISPGNPPRILYHRVHCAPCYGTPAMKTCKDNICMKEIEVEEVKRALEEAMSWEHAC